MEPPQEAGLSRFIPPGGAGGQSIRSFVPPLAIPLTLGIWREPIILAVDDDVNVLEAVVQDLRRRYGADYRVMRAAGGQAALDTLAQVKEREEAVALLVSDQRMPGMTGVQFLERSREIYPEARRVLLTAYADTEAAIQAINSARIHYYLNKPWDPPEEKLYPVLDDLLEGWKLGYRPRFEGLTVLGHRWSPRDHEVRTFLSCNHVSYRWLDVDGEEGSKLLQDRNIAGDSLPVVLFPDGALLKNPPPEELAARVGMKVQASERVLRPGGCGRGAGRSGGSGLRRQRRLEDAGHRVRRARRTGGHHLHDQELPGISPGDHGGGDGQARAAAGAVV